MRGSIRRRGNSFSVTVSAGFDPVTGRRIRLQRSAPTQAAAERELTALLRQVDTGSFADPSALTVGRFLVDQYLPFAESRVRPRTAARYRSLLAGHVLPAIGSVKLSKLRPAHIQAMLTAASGDVGPTTVGHVFRTLHMALGHAVRLNLLGSNPAAGIRPPSRSRPSLIVPGAEDVSRLMEAADGWTRTAVVLAASTGMRRGEVLGLQWQRVDLDGGTVEIALALENAGQALSFTVPKTPRSRRKVSLAPSTVAFLRRVRADQLERRLLLGSEWQGTDLVVERGDGGPIHPDLLSAAFRRLARRTGLAGVRLHDLRHFYASELLRANVHPKVVSDQLGHASVAFTMDVYSHLMPSAGQSAATAIEAALSFGE